MDTLERRVIDSTAQDDRLDAKKGMAQDLFNQRVSIVRSAAYQTKHSGKKSRLHLELDTYTESITHTQEQRGNSPRNTPSTRSVLEQKINLYLNDLPSLERYVFPHTKSVSPEADSHSVVSLLKDIDKAFIQAYAQHYLSKDQYHQLLDLHRLSLNYVLFMYDNAQQQMGNRAREAYLDKSLAHLKAALSPILHDTQNMNYISIITDSNLIQSTKEHMAESLFIDIANDLQHASSNTHDRTNLLSIIDKLNKEFYVDLTRQDGPLTRLEKISGKITDTVSQQTVLSLSRDISLRNNKYQSTTDTIPFIEQAYNTIIETLRSDLYRNIPTGEQFGQKNGMLEQVRDSFDSALVSPEFREALHAEIKESCFKTGDTSRLRQLLYGFGSAEEKSFYYLSINAVTNGVIEKFRNLERNLSRAAQEQDTSTVTNLLKRIEITLEKDPHKFGAHGSLLQSFISLFSKEAAYHLKLPNYANHPQPLEEQFRNELQSTQSSFRSKLKEKEDEYQKRPYEKTFEKRYHSFIQLEHEIRRRASEDYIKEELLSVEPIFRSHDHEDYTSKIQEYMITLFTSNSSLETVLKQDEESLRYSKSILHKIYLQMYRITSDVDFDNFFTGLQEVLRPHAGTQDVVDVEYFKSQLVVFDKYLEDEGLFVNREQLRYYIYRQAKQHWDYLDEEDHKRVNTYFAKRDAAKYKNVSSANLAA